MKNKLILGLIFYFLIILLGHLFHGSVDALKRLHLTRAMITKGSVITEKYGPVLHPPLQSFLMIPQYGLGYLTGKALGLSEKKSFRVAYRFCVYFFTPVLIAVICVLYFDFIGRLGFSQPIKLFSTYILLFGTLLLPYSKWLWSEPLSALLIISSLYCLFRSFTENFKKFNRLNFLLLGMLCLNAPVYNVHYAFMFLYVLFYFHFIKNNPENKKALVIDSSIIFFICTSLFLYYNYSRYGSIFEFGYGSNIPPQDELYQGTFGRPALEGLYSLLFAIGKGELIYSPLTFICPFVFLFFYHHMEKNIRFLFSALLISYITCLVIYAKWGMGSWVWGPRYLLPFFPAIHLLFPFLIVHAFKANRLTKGFLILVVIWGIGINGYEFIGGWQHFQHVNFIKTGVPYSHAVYIPGLSPLYNNWETSPNGLNRLVQFILVAAAGFYLVMGWYRKRFSNTL